MKSAIYVYVDRGVADRDGGTYADVLTAYGFRRRLQERGDVWLQPKPGTEIVFRSDESFFQLRKVFFERVVEPKRNYRTDEGSQIMGATKALGTSFPFDGAFYEDLLAQIEEKMGLKRCRVPDSAE